MVKIRNISYPKSFDKKKNLKNKVELIENLPIDYVPKNYSMDAYFQEDQVNIYPLQKVEVYIVTGDIKNYPVFHLKHALRISVKDGEKIIYYNFHFDPYEKRE
jgi:hypothetical protein